MCESASTFNRVLKYSKYLDRDKIIIHFSVRKFIYNLLLIVETHIV